MAIRLLQIVYESASSTDLDNTTAQTRKHKSERNTNPQVISSCLADYMLDNDLEYNTPEYYTECNTNPQVISSGITKLLQTKWYASCFMDATVSVTKQSFAAHNTNRCQI